MALLQLQQREADRKRIKLANVELMKGQMLCSERTMPSPPEKKQCNIFVADDDLKPCFFGTGVCEISLVIFAITGVLEAATTS